MGWNKIFLIKKFVSFTIRDLGNILVHTITIILNKDDFDNVN